MVAPGLLGRRDSQIVIGRAVKGAAGLLARSGPNTCPNHIQPFLGREQRLFAGMDADGDDQAVAQGDGVPDHVQMAVGDGIE